MTTSPKWRALALSTLALACGHAAPYAVAGTSVRNPAQGLRATFEAHQVSLAPTKGDWRGALQLTGYGCGDDVATLGAAHPRSKARRVEYVRVSARGTVREWYENTPQGLEQGFTLDQAPCAGGDVSLRVATGSLTPRLTADGKAIDLLDESGATRLHYTDLSAVDAAGRALTVAMNVREGRIALQVDARDAKYPIVVDPMVWAQQGGPLVSSDGAVSDYFGDSVALSGDTAIIGAPQAGPTGNGQAYAFVRSGMTWAQQGPPISASDGGQGYYFGAKVALSGSTAVVGAPRQKVGVNIWQGAAYAFVRTGTTWAQQGTPLLANDGADHDNFGSSVAVDGDTAAVGSQGTNGNNAVYVFVRSGNTWTQQGSKLVADDGPGGSFGAAVALSGNTLAVGAPGKAVPPAGAVGGVYVFVRSGSTWTQQGPRLLSSDFHSADALGSAVALSGDTVLAGAPGKSLGAGVRQGAAYVFTRSGTTWAQQGARLGASDAGDREEFGSSVALAGDTAVIGAPYQAIPTYEGAVYVFARSGTSFAQAGAKLKAGAANTFFGYSVAISNNTLIIGGSEATVGQNAKQGTAYAFFRAGAPGDACSSGGDCANGFCSDSVCCDVACDGACNACAVATGAAKDGTCKLLGKGAAGTPACDTLACNGVSAVCVACAQDSDCTADHYCAANGTCKPQVAQGDSCNTAAGKDCKVAGCDVCATGHCADGVCCESACGDACQACSLAFTGAPNGTCAPVPADQDPRNRCDEGAGYPGSCLSDGLCDGTGNCRDFAKNTVACGDTATTCSKGSVSGKLCDGKGTCATDTVSCAPYVCGGDGCTTSCETDDDCAASGYCLNETCQTKKDDGEACSSLAQCASNFCTDGVCCNAACDGQCEVCSDAGLCSPVTGEPQAGRPACSGDPAVCGGACDGQTRDACTYPSSAQSCGNSCTEGQQSPSVCDSAGGCVESTPIPCGNYACGETECLTTCSTGRDCAAGFSCADSQCTPTGSKCSEDLTSSVSDDRIKTLCAPYVCDASSGECKTECTSVDDCASGSVCNTSKSCVPASGSKSSDDSGCGCSIPGRRSSRAAWLLFAGLVLGLRGRRSRRIAR